MIDTVIHNDCLSVLRGMADNSVDSIVTDPPYALTSGRLRVGYEHCLRYILLQVQFPQFNYFDTKRLKTFKFANVLSDTSSLHSVNGSGIDARVSVPVRTIDFDHDAVTKQEINNESEATSTITKGELTSVNGSQSIELSSNFILQLRRGSSLSFCKGACSCYRSLGAGVFAFDVVVTRSSLGDSLFSSLFPSIASSNTNDVGLRNNALTDSCTSTSVVAGSTTEVTAMLTLDVRGGTFKLSPTNGTCQPYFLIERLVTDTIGTSKRASSFTSPLQSTSPESISLSTDGAYTLNKLLMCHEVTSFFSNYITNKGFMGKEWDNEAIAFSTDLWQEAMRVLRPGGHMVAFGGTRTYHRLASAIEDAGWECRDMLMWIHGQGFPKSLNLGGGRGTALKPAHEPIILARKPLAESSIAAQVLATGTGGLNIGATRISHNEPHKTTERTAPRYSGNTMNNGVRGGIQSTVASADPQGRFPSHLLLSHSPQLPLSRMLERIPLQIENDIRRYFDGYEKLSILRQRVRDISEQDTTWQRQALQQGMQMGSRSNDKRGRSSSIRHTSQRQNESTYLSQSQEGEYQGGEASQLERGQLHLPWLSAGTSDSENTRRAGDGAEDDERSGLYPRTSVSNGDANGACAEIIGICTPHERGQTGQQTGELDDNGRCATHETAQSDRAEVSSVGGGKPTLEVLTHDIPHEYLQYFQPAGNLGCVPRGTKRVRGNAPQGKPSLGKDIPRTSVNAYTPQKFIEGCYADSEGMETVEAYECAPDCPIAELDRQSGVRAAGYRKNPSTASGAFFGSIGEHVYGERGYDDQGGASRYFQHFPPDDYTPFLYQSKASRAERNRGCEDLPFVSAGKIGPEGHGKTVARCVEHDTPVPSGTNSYTCGCPIAYEGKKGNNGMSATNTHPT